MGSVFLHCMPLSHTVHQILTSDVTHADGQALGTRVRVTLWAVQVGDGRWHIVLIRQTQAILLHESFVDLGETHI